MTKLKYFNYQCEKLSETSQKKYKLYETKMIKKTDEWIDARNRKSSCCEQDR